MKRKSNEGRKKWKGLAGRAVRRLTLCDHDRQLVFTSAVVETTLTNRDRDRDRDIIKTRDHREPEETKIGYIRVKRMHHPKGLTADYNPNKASHDGKKTYFIVI